MSDRGADNEIWPTQALRAWLEALEGEIGRAREELENRINLAEKEVARLRRLHERAGQVMESLRESTGKVDIRIQELVNIQTGGAVEPVGVPHSSPERTASETESRKKREDTHKGENRPAGGRGTKG